MMSCSRLAPAIVGLMMVLFLVFTNASTNRNSYETAVDEQSTARQLESSGDYQGAVRHWTNAIRSRPNEPVYYLGRAHAYEALKWYPQACSDYSSVLKLQPGNRYVLYNRGQTLEEMGRYEEALTDYQRVLTVTPTERHLKERIRSLKEKIERARSRRDPAVVGSKN